MQQQQKENFRTIKQILDICHLNKINVNFIVANVIDGFILPRLLRFEDHVALDGGEDGLNTIKQILILAPQILINHG